MSQNKKVWNAMIVYIIFLLIYFDSCYKMMLLESMNTGTGSSQPMLAYMSTAIYRHTINGKLRQTP